jgi:hypothetical protein
VDHYGSISRRIHSATQLKPLREARTEATAAANRGLITSADAVEFATAVSARASGLYTTMIFNATSVKQLQDVGSKIEK